MAFGQYIQDLRLIVNMAREELPENRKIFLLGHSMGGLIALLFALQEPALINGVMTSSPGLGAAFKVPAFQHFFGKIMSMVWPGFLLSNGFDAMKISRDKDVVDAYQNDPLVHDRVSARWFTEILTAIAELNQCASQIKIPLLMQVAGNDHIVSAEMSRRFFKNVTLEDKTLHIYEDLYHEIYNELEKQREKVMDDLVSWLGNHIS